MERRLLGNGRGGAAGGSGKGAALLVDGCAHLPDVRVVGIQLERAVEVGQAEIRSVIKAYSSRSSCPGVTGTVSASGGGSSTATAAPMPHRDLTGAGTQRGGVAQRLDGSVRAAVGSRFSAPRSGSRRAAASEASTTGRAAACSQPRSLPPSRQGDPSERHRQQRRDAPPAPGPSAPRPSLVGGPGPFQVTCSQPRQLARRGAAGRTRSAARPPVTPRPLIPPPDRPPRVADLRGIRTDVPQGSLTGQPRGCARFSGRSISSRRSAGISFRSRTSSATPRPVANASLAISVAAA